MPSTEFSSELASALKENSFGLKGYQVIQETQLESVATVTLLEGDVVTVSLSRRGFEVLDKEREIIHETLEQLLVSLSTAYRLASQQALFSRLEGFATSDVDQGDPPC